MLGSQQGIRPQGSLQPSSSDATSATSGTNAGNASPNTRMQNEVDRTNAMATERLKSLLFSRSSTGTSAKADVGPPKSSLLLQHRNAIINDNGDSSEKKVDIAKQTIPDKTTTGSTASSVSDDKNEEKNNKINITAKPFEPKNALPTPTIMGQPIPNMMGQPIPNMMGQPIRMSMPSMQQPVATPVMSMMSQQQLQQQFQQQQMQAMQSTPTKKTTLLSSDSPEFKPKTLLMMESSSFLNSGKLNMEPQLLLPKSTKAI